MNDFYDSAKSFGSDACQNKDAVLLSAVGGDADAASKLLVPGPYNDYYAVETLLNLILANPGQCETVCSVAEKFPSTIAPAAIAFVLSNPELFEAGYLDRIASIPDF